VNKREKRDLKCSVEFFLMAKESCFWHVYDWVAQSEEESLKLMSIRSHG
jgi:hypothetical protein